MTVFKGKISVARFTSNTEPHDGVTIELVDEVSGIHVARINLTIEQFGLALSGRAYTDCSFELGRLESVGKKRVIKHELLSFSFRPKLNQIIDRATQYEVDGWKCVQSKYAKVDTDYLSGRYIVSVPFERYEDAV